MPFIIQGTSGGGNVQQEIDATSKAAHTTLYDAAGNVIAKADRAVSTPGTSSGMAISGADYKVSRLVRSSPDGTLRTSKDTLLLYDSIEGAAVDTNKWIQATTTMTITQATGLITFNAGSSAVTTVGAQQLSHRFFPYIARQPIVFRTRARHTAHFNNNLIEMGFMSPASQTGASIGNGAIWRKDGTGQYVPVLSFAGSETLGTAISNATWIGAGGIAATDYGIFEVMLEDTRAKFSAFTQTGVLVNEQYLDYGTTTFGFQATHLQAGHRTYNSAGTGTAVQLLVSNTSVYYIDSETNRDWPTIQSGMAYAQATSPTAYTSINNYANSAAPASAALSNTAAGYVNLGGQWQFAAVATAETDFALFAIAIPSPYHFYFTGIRISAWNSVVAVATTATVLQWGIAVNSSAVSLATAAPYAPMRFAVGTQTFPVAATVGATAADVIWQPKTPICVFPGRFFHVVLKVPLGTATATEIFRGTATVEGYFE